jgi:hypothetical protein
MPLYICRWQNGDFSAVPAASKKAASEFVSLRLVNRPGIAPGFFRNEWQPFSYPLTSIKTAGSLQGSWSADTN